MVAIRLVIGIIGALSILIGLMMLALCVAAGQANKKEEKDE